MISTASLDNTVQVYSIDKEDLIKQANLEFSNPKNEKMKEQPL